ncbi:hypothetical protein BS17DRAFT_772390, partial [Gyrodon lividus]
MEGYPEHGSPICHYSGINSKSYTLAEAVLDTSSSQRVPPVQAVEFTHSSGIPHPQSANSGSAQVVENYGNAGGKHLDIRHQDTAETVSRKPKTNYHLCPKQPCQWWYPDGHVCGQLISCGSAPIHFKKVHGIATIHKSNEVICSWDGCFQGTVRRSNFVRHIREGETHLGHKRDVDHH